MVESNDADKRPRLYGKIATRDAEVELTVRGGEGEKASDIEGIFDDKLEALAHTSASLPEEETDTKGCQ